MGIILRWLPVYLTAIVIFYLSTTPIIIIRKPPFPHYDKVFHAVEYFILAYFLLKALLKSQKNYVNKIICLWVFLIPTLFGIFIEIWQIYVPGRDCSFLDMAANSIGAVFVIGLHFLLTTKITE